VLVGFHSRQLGVEHRVLCLLDRGVCEFDREHRVCSLPFGAVLGALEVVPGPFGIDAFPDLRHVLVPRALQVVPPDRQLALVRLGRLSQLLSLGLSGRSRALNVRVKVGLGLLPRSRRVLVYVHGFNNHFDDAVYQLAQIAHDSGADAAPILFTWPSRGSLFEYVYDRESTNSSRDALEETLRSIAKDPGVGEITVMAHSMGSWLLMETLRQMSIREGRVQPKICNVILASPDLDVDVFATQWRDIGQPRPRLTVFVSRNDTALRVSRRLAGNVDRLGQIDPMSEAYHSALANFGIDVIDLTDLTVANSCKFARNNDPLRGDFASNSNPS